MLVKFSKDILHALAQFCQVKLLGLVYEFVLYFLASACEDLLAILVKVLPEFLLNGLHAY